MNINELEQLKEGYKKLIDNRDELNNLMSLKKELENNDIVKTYLSVLEKIEEFEDESIINANDKALMDKVIERMNIKTSNGIYVYFGTYYEVGNDCYITNYHDPNAHYSKYVDIEKHHSYAGIEVPINEREEFEKNNNIIMPKTLGSRKDLYDYVRDIFFETCIIENQEKAVERVLKIRDNN